LIYLLDTCVLSEATKATQSSSVMSWLSSHELERQYVSAVTIGELHYGVERMNHGRKRDGLRVWLKEVEEDYDGRIVPLDQVVAERWGLLRAMVPNIQTVDAQLAATALAYDFTFVTRNVRHFPFEGLRVFNPWQS
jgi:toxin FitB